ncbi:restriction endonuclease subunit S [bacterium]|nr:restriction endonuclease subunit S [bacterium]
MNVPKLRFKEFKDDWNLIRLGDCCNLITKGTTPNRFSEYGIKFIKIESLINKKIDNNKCLYVDEITHITSLKRSVLEEKDVLFAIAGATIGKCGIIEKEDLPSNTNQALAILRTNQKKLNPYFLLNVLDSNIMKKYILLNISVGAQPNLNLEQMNNFKFKLPSEEEQLKVANFLSLLDKKIELQSKKIEDLKLFKKGLLKKNYYKIANNNLTELSCIANIYQPQTISQSELDNGKYYVFGANGIIGKYSKFNHKFMQVTISCRGENSGTINLTPYECWITGNSMVLNVDENKNVDKLYLKNILEAQNLKYLISGSGQPQIVRSSVLKHKIPYISIEQQKKFTIPFIKLDSKIKLEQNKLIKLQKLKKGLMQNMFV